MRECLRCGYKDLPIWRHKRQRLFTCYCHITELEDWDPALARMVREEKDLKIGPYIYHLTKAGYVDRIHESDSKDGKSWREPEQEKHFPFQHPNQTRLESSIMITTGEI